ncbi:hemolysin-III related-domain-containing protein [Vararia minispora EC-137]|uniref:Hemolysin-III related-domain-containing protein n=1 Tax=Vararia minispora EC-137 TaxID=1314806 RepID=A0ACB8QKD0_9AGAM|nr:hemolysin-III related-domain-containing protein [Vararia minispora EC-137]
MTPVESTPLISPQTVASSSLAKHKRKPSAALPTFGAASPSISCQDFPHSLEALDLSLPSPIQTLASLRIVLLNYLSHLEHALSELDSPLVELEHGIDDALANAGVKMDEARQWARDGLKLLSEIRADVSSRLPDLNVEPPTIDQLVARLQDLRDAAYHLSPLEDVKARLSDLDIPHPIQYIPTLSARLQSLHAHISTIELPSTRPFHSFHPTQFLSDLCDRLASLNFVQDVLHAPVVEQTEEKISKAARDIAAAVQLSLQGSRLISYDNLPEEWRNNPFITHGYRFIPLNRWHILALSIFALHNETLNIHTHLIPFLLWARSMIPTRFTPIPSDVPLFLFTLFALLCLFTSALWHTMAGCAHRTGMVLSAKLDYIGIGWLICASVGTIVWYGFQGFDGWQRCYVGLCVVMGFAGSILPFYDWFNTPEHKLTRVAFFLSLALTALVPLSHLSLLYTSRAVLTFITPLVPSFLSYLGGLFFYVTNLPERATPPRWAPYLFYCGGGSHAIWHAFIVLAIAQHRGAMAELAKGVPAV